MSEHLGYSQEEARLDRVLRDAQQRIRELTAQIDGLSLAATQYSESRDRWAARARELAARVAVLEAEHAGLRDALALTFGALKEVDRHNPGGVLVGVAIGVARLALRKSPSTDGE